MFSSLFNWLMGAGRELAVVLISMVPLVELRGAVPLGAVAGVPAIALIPLAVIGNMIPIPFLLFFGEKLLDWLDNKTDFFSAPASTRFHGACDGGLCMHSLNVYHALHDGFFTEGESEESYAICALLHDLCKANYYKKGTRNVKNDATGQWEKVPSYSVEDLFPYGHGEKSVFLIERFMKLKVEEAVAIRWHMGGFDDAAKGGCFAISEAYDKYPLAVKLHIADLKATYLMEHRTSAVR